MIRCARQLLALTVMICSLNACVTATIDEMVFNEPTSGIGEASVAILGRRHASNYDTEPEFVRCIGNYIRARDSSVTVIDEPEFLDAFYPWFEPRTAPLRPADLDELLGQQPVTDKVNELKVSYIIWIDGSTVRSSTSGSMSCAVAPGAGGCFGFSTWSNDSDYEATIWDFTNQAEMGRVNASASGQSYMPALIIPIPIIAPVQGTACDSLAQQLLQFLSGEY